MGVVACSPQTDTLGPAPVCQAAGVSNAPPICFARRRWSACMTALVPLTLTARTQFFLVVPADSSSTSVKDLLAKRTGVAIEVIPYQGSLPRLVDLIAGRQTARPGGIGRHAGSASAAAGARLQLPSRPPKVAMESSDSREAIKSGKRSSTPGRGLPDEARSIGLEYAVQVGRQPS